MSKKRGYFAPLFFVKDVLFYVIITQVLLIKNTTDGQKKIKH